MLWRRRTRLGHIFLNVITKPGFGQEGGLRRPGFPRPPWFWHSTCRGAPGEEGAVGQLQAGPWPGCQKPSFRMGPGRCWRPLGTALKPTGLRVWGAGGWAPSAQCSGPSTLPALTSVPCLQHHAHHGGGPRTQGRAKRMPAPQQGSDCRRCSYYSHRTRTKRERTGPHSHLGGVQTRPPPLTGYTPLDSQCQSDVPEVLQEYKRNSHTVGAQGLQVGAVACSLHFRSWVCSPMRSCKPLEGGAGSSTCLPPNT